MRSNLAAIVLFMGLLGCQTGPSLDDGLLLHIFSVHHFGAKGDGRNIDTRAINQAISAASASGGGTVWFSAGTYLVSSIHLQSNVTLDLGPGSVIEAADYHLAPADPPEPRPPAQDSYQDFGHSHTHDALIWGDRLHDISILGSGLIYGKGLESGVNPYYDKAKGEKQYYAISKGAGDKAIALRECRNVTLRDFSILQGGWFGILATGTDNLTIDHLKIDTGRDGMDIDACNDVRVTNTSVNSPWDDGICLKASLALGYPRACENIMISSCFVSGNFDEGTLIDGSFSRSGPEYKSYRTGRIKIGTESNGDFRNIAITNCVFDDCRGIAIESVDGSHIEDITISNITMRHVSNAPLFLRLGSRLRGPKNTTVVGTIRRINMSNIVASDVRRDCASTIAGIVGHPIEDIRISNFYVLNEGGGEKAQDSSALPEKEAAYPEPGMFGVTPSYGVFVRHARNIEFDYDTLQTVSPDHRPPFAFIDVDGVRVQGANWQNSIEGISAELQDVRSLQILGCAPIPDRQLENAVKLQF